MSEKFNRKERRYLVDDIHFVTDHIWEVYSDYDVSTDYYDFIKPGWSKGKSGAKVRVRIYDECSTFIEVKHGDDKKRKPISELLRKWIKKLNYIFTIKYSRREYKEGDCRVTVDKNVTLWYHNKKIATLLGFVVETKGKAPEWMILPKEKKNWSKSKWALKSKSK